MIKVFTALTQQHDLRLVAVAIVVCLAASFAALTLVAQGVGSRRSRHWLALGAVTFGSGAWATHFISMLAFLPGASADYALGLTALSIALAIGGALIGLSRFLKTDRRPVDSWAGGLVLGAAITTMHFVGLSAVRTSGSIDYDPGYVVASLLVGAAFATAGCSVGSRIRAPGPRLAAAGFLALSVVALHFTGMASVTILPGPVESAEPDMIASKTLAFGITIIGLGVLAFGVAAARYDRHVMLREEREIARFRQLADATFSGIVIHRDGVILDVNAAYCEFLGYEKAELIGGEVWNTVAPDCLERVKERVRRGDLDSEESDVIRKSGERRTVKVITRMIEYGGRMARVSALSDITERKRDDLLQAGEHRILTGIAENRPLSEILTEVCLTAESVLPDAACSVLLMSADGKHLQHGAAPHLPKKYCEVIDGVAIGPSVGSCGTAAYRRQPVFVEDIASDPLWADFRDFTLGFGLRACWSIPLLAKDGKVLGSFATYQFRPYLPSAYDLKVIDRFAASAAIAIQRAQLDRELIAARDRAETASRSKSEFLANMSHELRTPLNAILGFSEIISSQTLGPAAHDRYIEYAKDIHDSGSYLLSLINDVLDVSRVEAGRVEIKQERCDLAAVIDEQLRVIRRAYPEAAPILPSLGSDCPDLLVDHRALGQMLLNVIGNAAKFTPAEGRIAITVDGALPGLRLRIEDTGPGIPAAMLKELGKPFRQVESAYNRRHGGTGLGLYISRSLIELHGGELKIASQLGKGTTVTLEFPETCVIREEATAAAAHSEAKALAAGE